MKLQLSQVAEILQARVVRERDDAAVDSVSVDTRNLDAGALFVALRGERFDGHDFVRRAASLGAAGALVEREVDVPLPQIVVPDTLAGLQRLGAAWRLRCAVPAVGVTGSNGKTTVKEMLAVILGARGPTLATRGNFNNHIGVPLTLLRLRPEHAFAVVEMGANHPGEIALLARLARPNVGVITNAADAHLEGFGSREGVARAKGELFADLAADGTAVINADDRYAPLWAELAGDRRQVLFGFGRPADVTARAIEPDGSLTRFTLVTPDGEAAVELPLAGKHNVANALAASASAWALDLSAAEIAAGLGSVTPVAGRLQQRPAVGGAVLIDDTYNANPGSLAAALDVLTAQRGETWLVLGDMAELGRDAEAVHAEAGRAARAVGVTQLFAVGPLSRAAVETFGEGGRHFDEREALIAALRQAMSPGITVLIKGSRSAGMERVVAALEASPSRTAGGAGC